MGPTVTGTCAEGNGADASDGNPNCVCNAGSFTECTGCGCYDSSVDWFPQACEDCQCVKPPCTPGPTVTGTCAERNGADATDGHPNCVCNVDAFTECTGCGCYDSAVDWFPQDCVDCQCVEDDRVATPTPAPSATPMVDNSKGS